jgi:hypothetical protein
MRGDGSVYKRGNIWWMSFYRDGRQVLMSCKTESEQIARAKLRKVMRMSDDEFSEPKFRRVTIGELIQNVLDHYEMSGLEDFRADTKSRWDLHLSKRFDKLKAYLFCSTQQKAYRGERLQEGAANATINRELQILVRHSTSRLSKSRRWSKKCRSSTSRKKIMRGVVSLTAPRWKR